jgi:hypothetical protein
VESNPVQFHVNPQLPKKANKQGTLFSAQKKYSRGYTPQRMKDVNNNLNSVQTPQSSSGETHPFTGPEGAAKVRETLARSRVPAAAMKGASVIVRGKSDAPANNPNVSGVYRPNGNRTAGNISLFAKTDHSAKYGQPDSATKQSARQSAEVTLLHEMGHHRSAMAKTPQSNYLNDAHRGQEEGYADHHAMNAWVPDSRDKNTNKTQILSHNSYAPTLDNKSTEFQGGYTSTRNKMTQPAQFPPSAKKHTQGTLF